MAGVARKGVGVTFDQWLAEFATTSRARAMFVASENRRKRVEAAERRRERSKEPLVSFDIGKSIATVPNSVFALGALAVTPAGRSYTDQVKPATKARRSPVTPVQGAGAKRREGDEVHLTDSSFKATTWRAPWAPGYTLAKGRNT